MPSSSIVFAGLMPHAPILVPSVGRSHAAEVRRTTAAMSELSRHAVLAAPDVMVLLSPHSPRHRDAFGFWHLDPLQGSFAVFGSDEDPVSLPLASRVTHAIEEEATARGLRTWRIMRGTLDHGAAVPLHYLMHAGWRGPTVIVGVNDLDGTSLIRFGEAIAAAAKATDQRIAVIASGDMSHRLTPSAPCGYDPAGPKFDAMFIELLESGAPADILHLDRALCETAAEDATAVTIIAVAATEYRREHRRVLSYEGPFGVGYGVVILCAPAVEATGAPAVARTGLVITDPGELPYIARCSVAAYLDGSSRPPAFRAGGELVAPHGVFVTLHTEDDVLRGCRGTAYPGNRDVVAGTWLHAREAAFADPRFEPLTAEELPRIRFSVSILSGLEPVRTLEELDPARYGILVTAADARRCGLLLPGISHIDSAGAQVRIAREKAGIDPGEHLLIQRFTTQQFHECLPVPAGDSAHVR